MIHSKIPGEKPPFEVTETGWGEFDIPITIYYIDPNESPLSVHQMLQLYHKDGIQSSKPVVSEHYDEFVFNNPGLDMTEVLSSNPLDKLAAPKPTPQEFEQQELIRIKEAQDKVLAEYEVNKVQFAAFEEELAGLQEEANIMKMTSDK